VNQEKLNHIATYPSEITADDARELDELTRNFPYFTLPYVLLSKYYSNTNDYRFEELLHKTALRVSDREWLQQFIKGSIVATEVAEVSNSLNVEAPEVDEIATSGQEIIDLISETISDSPVLEHGEEKSIPFESQDVKVAESPTQALEIEAKTEELIAVEDGDMDDFTFGGMTRIIEIDTDDKTYAEAEDEVFEEIGSFDDMGAEKSSEDANETANLPEFQLRELMVEPHLESDTHEFELQETQKPDNESISKTRAKVNYGGSVYSIEDYYPSLDSTEKPVDFFGWLSNPAFTTSDPTEDKIIPTVDHKTELIAQFIKNNPSISTPKADFFNATEVAKKSDNLPQGLVTETLASVYMQQGNYSGAIRIYENLILKIPQKSTYFAALIEKLKKEHNL
jgi:tetratricopeptide (TPR) repeat protein